MSQWSVDSVGKTLCNGCMSEREACTQERLRKTPVHFLWTTGLAWGLSLHPISYSEEADLLMMPEIFEIVKIVEAEWHEAVLIQCSISLREWEKPRDEGMPVHMKTFPPTQVYFRHTRTHILTQCHTCCVFLYCFRKSNFLAIRLYERVYRNDQTECVCVCVVGEYSFVDCGR